MEAVRSLGLAAHFVSGYLHVPEGASGTRGAGATHAWLRVYLPGAGWVEFDPTNGIVGSHDLIRVGSRRETSGRRCTAAASGGKAERIPPFACHHGPERRAARQ